MVPGRPRIFDLLATRDFLDERAASRHAQGLQSGQALRNILLDPSNSKAYDNFTAAREAFEQAYAATQQSANGTAFEEAIASLSTLRSNQFALQDPVQTLARSSSAGADQARGTKSHASGNTGGSGEAAGD